MANEQQFTEGQTLRGSDGNTYVVRGGVPRVVLGPASAGATPVIQRPQAAPQVTPIGPKDTPEFRAAVAAAEAAAKEGVGRQVVQAQKAMGQSQLSRAVADMRGEYRKLKEQGGAITSRQGLLDNVTNWAAANAGEMLGNPTASEAESTRQTIRNMRQALVRGIAAATGITAQQLNSNVELQQMLNMATDPSQSLETVNRTLDFIERQYGSPAAPGAKAMGAAKPAPAATGGWGKARVKGR